MKKVKLDVSRFINEDDLRYNAVMEFEVIDENEDNYLIEYEEELIWVAKILEVG